VEVVDHGDTHVVLIYLNVLTVLWRGAHDPSVCQKLYKRSVDLAKRSTVGAMSAVSVVHAGTPAPSPAAREALAQLHDDREGVIYRSAVVFRGDGFIASIIRSIALGIQQRSTRHGNHKMFQELREAMTWATTGLPTATGVPVPIEPLLLAVESHDVAGHMKVG